MARPRLQSLGQDALPFSPSPPRLPPSGRVEMPTVDGAAAAFACRSAPLHLSGACHFRMNDSAPSSTRRNHLPAFCASFRHPSYFTPKADIPSFRCTIQSFSCPLSSPYPQQAPQTSPCGRRSSRIRAPNRAKKVHAPMERCARKVLNDRIRCMHHKFANQETKLSATDHPFRLKTV